MNGCTNGCTKMDVQRQGSVVNGCIYKDGWTKTGQLGEWMYIQRWMAKDRAAWHMTINNCCALCVEKKGVNHLALTTLTQVSK